MSDKMLAVEAPGPGAPDRLVLRSLDRPAPGPGEILVRVHAAGVNRGDVKQRHGDYPQLPAGATNVLGLEVAGVVEACGADVTAWRQGDRVCALLLGGGYAEYCVVPAGQCLPIPANLDFVQAACLPETFATVWQTLFMMGRLQPGESVLVHGGSSGIGVAALQLASALGSRVFATAGSASKCAFCESIGAEVAINYRDEDFSSRILALTEGKGVDVILDMVGGPYAARNMACLANDGRLSFVAGDGGQQVAFTVRDIMIRRLTVTGATLRHRSVQEKERILGELRRVAWPLLDRGAIRPIVDRVFPLVEAEAAHAHLEAGSVIGKVILQVR